MIIFRDIVRCVPPWGRAPLWSGAARDAFSVWCDVPAPRRGELIRLLGEELRASKEALGAALTLEAGKIVSEGLGEVQEMIDMREAATFLSATGSDCGIANVNIGPSGAEIGGAFGARRRPAGGASPAQTRGKAICAAKSAPSTILPNCRSPKA